LIGKKRILKKSFCYNEIIIRHGENIHQGINMKNAIILPIMLSIAIGISCSQPAKIETNSNSASLPVVNSAKTEKPTTILEFSSNPKEVTSNQQTELSFAIKSSTGEIINDLKVMHEKRMHLLIVSSDLSEFYHLHPEMQSDGSFKVPYAFPNGGKYKMFVDFTLADGKQVVHTDEVVVKGDALLPEKLVAEEKFEQSTGGIKVVMKPDGDFIAGKQMLLGFDVFDIASKKPATDLQNYLGEKAHFVVISEDLNEFVHAHPISTVMKKDEHSEHSHDANLPNRTSVGGSEVIVSAHITFPKAGIYKLWAQFQRNGRVIDVPFIVNVKPDSDVANTGSNTEIPKDAYQIKVGKDGFSPSDVSFAIGDYKRLAFLRTDSQNCADEVIFRDLKIMTKLPVGEVVFVDLPDDSKGKIYSFACGMSMFKGKVVIQ
jgi:hypothetical protein